jgi:hypothetical protein
LGNPKDILLWLKDTLQKAEDRAISVSSLIIEGEVRLLEKEDRTQLIKYLEDLDYAERSNSGG